MNLPRIAFVSILLALAGCSESAPEQPPLAGSSIGGPFTLINPQGKTVRSSDFDGKYRIVYFGYTYCPDVCPVDMQNIGGGMAKLRKEDPDLAQKIAVIFITLDPQRDTPEVTGKFVSAFGPYIIGLTGNAWAIDAAAKEYKVYYKKVQPEGASGYLINHSNASYLMGPKGEPIALLPADESPQAVADELRKWVK